MESKFYVSASYYDGTLYDNGLGYESREACLEAVNRVSEQLGQKPFRIDIKEVMFQY
jgi:hypothetical protein